VFTIEVKRWKARWELYPTDQINPSNLCETLELVNKNLYLNIYNMIVAMPRLIGFTVPLWRVNMSLHVSKC
jgi:hypothetical protein